MDEWSSLDVVYPVVLICLYEVVRYTLQLITRTNARAANHTNAHKGVPTTDPSRTGFNQLPDASINEHHLLHLIISKFTSLVDLTTPLLDPATDPLLCSYTSNGHGLAEVPPYGTAVAEVCGEELVHRALLAMDCVDSRIRHLTRYHLLLLAIPTYESHHSA
jgi:hypothetical protein